MSADQEICPDCNGTGWLHMEFPFEIEKCDSCGTLQSDDEAARLHTEAGHCDWPPHDYHDAFLAHFDLDRNLRVALPEELRDLVKKVREVAQARLQFIDNLESLMGSVGQLVHMAITHPDKDSRLWIDELLTYLRGAGSLLLDIRYQVSNGLWKKHWLLTPEDGTYDDKTGLWHAPPQGGMHGKS